MSEMENRIAERLGSTLVSSHRAGGGCIHESSGWILADGRRVFVKQADASQAELLSAERMGLELLAPHIRVPAVLDQGRLGGASWLALEWLDLRPMNRGAWGDLGQRLAAMHAVNATEHGLDHDNFIGATPQINRRSASWSGFYQECRLLPQMEIAGRNGHDLPVSKILDRAAELLAGHEPRPALLHGDLWAGNAAALADGGAVVFDPAPYFGDPETDLAMLELFGGALTREFLEGYGPLTKDRWKRRPLYDLYHALNHLNLFGPGYAGMVRSLLSKIGVG